MDKAADVRRHLALSDNPSDGDLDLYFDFMFSQHRPPLMHADRGWHPPADLYETEQHIVLQVDIAGVELQQVNLVLEKDTLVLRGVRQEKRDRDPKRQYHKMEVPYGPFERVFRLPTPVCGEGVQAEYKQGFLTVRLEKRTEPPRRKLTIRIQ